MRLFITGCNGMLGSRITEEARLRGHKVAAFDRPELELGKPDDAAALLRAANPDLLIHCAALTDVDGCESHEEEAMLINGEATGVLAEAAAAMNARCIYISTDYVFAGDKAVPYLEEDPVDPPSVYGRSKLHGEKRVRAAGGSIVRLSWSFGPTGKNFVATIAELLLAGRELKVVDDQRGGPTYTRDAAAAILDLAIQDHSGIYHLSNSGETTWFGFARAIASELGLPASQVSACTSDEYLRPAPRPANSRLGGQRLTDLIGRTIPTWEDALRRYIKEEGWLRK
ncbi:MAG: dTDP-4-dehydrorhamnose reductase [bacterium]|nr:dTDP-4-dehydrorhamnose reductase [bacterium]